MAHVLFSTTVLASFLAGLVALLAPCCVSVMLPAFFASTFRKRHQILGMTLVFAAGVATIILPIALGAAVISRILIGYHIWIFSIMGILMVAAGVATLLGGKMVLPMPTAPAMGNGAGSVYGLGAFSGAASACCAPVLAGVAALSGAASSVPVAAIDGTAYVFGMVAPLCALALVWDRKNWGQSRLFTARTVRLWPTLRRLPVGRLLSGALMTGMGVLTVVIGLRGPGMGTDGWQVQVTGALDHGAARVLRALTIVPGWVFTLIVFTGIAALMVKAWRSRTRAAAKADAPLPDDGGGDGSCPPQDLGDVTGTAGPDTPRHAQTPEGVNAHGSQ